MATLTAEQMAEIHHLSFKTPRPWSADEIQELQNTKGTIAIQNKHGFLLGRHIAGEVELLTIAVHPKARRTGVGQALVEDFLSEAKAIGAESVFLEVAHNNAPALALYQNLGFSQVGKRPGYYGAGTDALILRLDLANTSSVAQLGG